MEESIWKLAYIPSQPFLGLHAPWISHIFSQWLLQGCTLFLQPGCFGLDVFLHSIKKKNRYLQKWPVFTLWVTYSFYLHMHKLLLSTGMYTDSYNSTHKVFVIIYVKAHPICGLVQQYCNLQIASCIELIGKLIIRCVFSSNCDKERKWIAQGHFDIKKHLHLAYS